MDNAECGTYMEGKWIVWIGDIFMTKKNRKWDLIDVNSMSGKRQR